MGVIVAIRGENGNYNHRFAEHNNTAIVAIRGENGNYNLISHGLLPLRIVAIRGENGNYNAEGKHVNTSSPYSNARTRLRKWKRQNDIA